MGEFEFSITEAVGRRIETKKRIAQQGGKGNKARSVGRKM